MVHARYMQAHVHTSVTQRHMHTSAIALFYVRALVRTCTLKNRCDSFSFKSYNLICLHTIMFYETIRDV